MKTFIYIIMVVVAAAIIGGFFVVGSPQEERLRQFDARRVGDLQMLQGQIINYWQQKGRLPENLDQLKDDISGFRPPQDPQTQEAYGYERTGNLSFRLCATFVRETTGQAQSQAPRYYATPYPEPFGENWQHGEGRQCFERTIDPELYQPIKRPI